MWIPQHRIYPLSCIVSVVAMLALSGDVAGQQTNLWLDPRVSRLPTDMLGPFVRTAEGKVLAIHSDATFVSSDDGQTWSKPRPLTGASEKHIKVSNERAMMRTKAGTIIAAYMNLNERNWTWSNELHDAPEARLPTWVMRSEDDGATWNHVQKLHDDWSGAVRDMIQTKDGRIVFTAMKMLHDPGRHAVLTYWSKDDGRTWKASNLIDLGGTGHHGGVTEPTLTELPDGRLWMLIRTNWGEFWSAYSHDGGRFWRVIQPSGIAASSAPGLLKRLQSGRLMLVWNRPFPAGKTVWPLTGGDGLWSETPVSNHRDELSLALSDDNGKSWSDPIVIARSRTPTDAKHNRWIAYPYVFQLPSGEIWITTMQGGLRIRLQESDFVAETESNCIVTFGDSTTAARPGLAAVYSELLQDGLADRGTPARVINAGVRGNHTEHARARFEADVLARNPDTVVIQFGINDAAVDVWKVPPVTESRVSLKAFEANLQHFVETLKGRGINVILMTPNPLCWTEELRERYGKPPYDVDDEDGFNVRLCEYADKVRHIATSQDVPLVDVYRAFQEFAKPDGKKVADLLLDGMHPNQRGHRLVADQLLRQINR